MAATLKSVDPSSEIGFTQLPTTAGAKVGLSNAGGWTRFNKFLKATWAQTKTQPWLMDEFICHKIACCCYFPP